MGRPAAVGLGTLTPDQRPRLVLEFGGGYFPDAPVRQAHGSPSSRGYFSRAAGTARS